MKLPKSLVITDIGSTNTKAHYFELERTHYRLVGSSVAATTVEKPVEDVRVGLLEAIRLLGEFVGKEFVRDDQIVFGEAFEAFLSTSSAGGGLQIIVTGLAKNVSAKSAYRAASVSGGIILDVFALDERKPHEKLEALEEMRPDMILMAGGIDGGDVINVVRMAHILRSAELVPKFSSEMKLPVVYAGNIHAREPVKRILADKVELVIVDNLRPAFDHEVIEPTRDAIHDLFVTNVMGRAPGYADIRDWTFVPIRPTPVAVEGILRIFTEKTGKSTMFVDIGGATTDVFSYYDGEYSRTVSANLGMSYSISNVMLEAGLDAIRRWLPDGTSEQDVRNIIANKCINPTRMPLLPIEQKIEWACCREALRLALALHFEFTAKVHQVTILDLLSSLFVGNVKKRFGECHYLDLAKITNIIGSGGVLSKAINSNTAVMMMVDGLQPVGITHLALDKDFLSPHIGLIADLDAEIAYETFMSECYFPLATCIAFSGKVRPDKPVAHVWIDGTDLQDEFEIKGGEIRCVSLGPQEEVRLHVKPYRGIDAGNGSRIPVDVIVTGGAVGLIFDARGRPLQFPDDPVRRAAVALDWANSFGVTS